MPSYENPLVASFRSMLEDLDRGLPFEMFQRKVGEFLKSVTHDPNPRRMIDQFGKKLLFPQWREDWQKYGCVCSALFGDVNRPGVCRCLHQLVTELVASEAGSPLATEWNSYRWRIHSALLAFLHPLFDSLIPSPPSEFNPVASETVLPLPLGYVLSRDFPADHLVGSVFGFPDPHAETDLELARQLAMFDELTLAPPVPNERAAYVFKKTSNTWRIYFNGTTMEGVKDAKAIKDIYYLLSRPNEPVSIFDLPDNKGTRVPADSVDVATKDDRDLLRQQYYQLKHNIEKLKADGAASLEIQEEEVEFAEVNRQLTQNFDIHGNPRQLSGDLSKAVGRTKKRFYRLLDEWAKTDELRELVTFLGKYLTIDVDCQYEPPPNFPPWET